MPLDRVLRRVREEPRAVLVFDLDSTLFSTAPRNLAILREFAARPEADADLRRIVLRLGDGDMGWNVMDDLRRHGYAHEPTLAALREFWRARFFTDEYLRHDVPIAGAPAYVRDAHGAGATIVYLTGRDEPGMGKGTRASLRAHGFPLPGERVRLFLKPTFEEEDLVFKQRAVGDLRALGQVIGAFENEPKNANYFAEVFPAADVLFVETVHSPNPPPLSPRIVRIRDFVRRAS